jgi:hypothetical protein
MQLQKQQADLWQAKVAKAAAEAPAVAAEPSGRSAASNRVVVREWQAPGAKAKLTDEVRGCVDKALCGHCRVTRYRSHCDGPASEAGDPRRVPPSRAGPCMQNRPSSSGMAGKPGKKPVPVVSATATNLAAAGVLRAALRARQLGNLPAPGGAALGDST